MMHWIVPSVAMRSFARRVSVAAFLAPTVFTMGLPAVAAADFGSPPPGQYPIIFNDRNVYATPDILKRARVLAALVRNGQIYVPLRSMFEEMGATVSATRDGRTVTAMKTGASVTVTLGKSEVLINGESRPLDVPPVLYRGIVLVPVRVISEALGAYVQWVPSRQIVVVRYLTTIATPPPAIVPTAAPTATPTTAPTAGPTPVPTAAVTAAPFRGFVQAAYFAPKNYNEFSAGKYCPEAFLVAGGYAFKNSPFAVKVDYRQYAYVTSDNLTDGIGNRYTRFATIDGGFATTPVFLARQSTLDARLELFVAKPRIYLGAGFLRASNNYGYPQFNAVGFGGEKFPELKSGVSAFGSAFYYPNARGNYTVSNPASSNLGRSYLQSYGIIKYDIGVTVATAKFPAYAYGGFAGDRFLTKTNAPIGQTHDGPYVGLGLRF